MREARAYGHMPVCQAVGSPDEGRYALSLQPNKYSSAIVAAAAGVEAHQAEAHQAEVH